MFALALAVLAAYTDTLVPITVLVHILNLEIVCFLKAENIRFLVRYHHCGSRISVFPGVGAVLGDAHPDIVRNHGDFRRFVVLRGSNETGRKCQSKNDCKFFHNFNV